VRSWPAASQVGRTRTHGRRCAARERQSRGTWGRKGGQGTTTGSWCRQGLPARTNQAGVPASSLVSLHLTSTPNRARVALPRRQHRLRVSSPTPRSAASSTSRRPDGERRRTRRRRPIRSPGSAASAISWTLLSAVPAESGGGRGRAAGAGRRDALIRMRLDAGGVRGRPHKGTTVDTPCCATSAPAAAARRAALRSCVTPAAAREVRACSARSRPGRHQPHLPVCRGLGQVIPDRAGIAAATAAYVRGRSVTVKMPAGGLGRLAGATGQPGRGRSGGGRPVICMWRSEEPRTSVHPRGVDLHCVLPLP